MRHLFLVHISILVFPIIASGQNAKSENWVTSPSADTIIQKSTGLCPKALRLTLRDTRMLASNLQKKDLDSVLALVNVQLTKNKTGWTIRIYVDKPNISKLRDWKEFPFNEILKHGDRWREGSKEITIEEILLSIQGTLAFGVRYADGTIYLSSTF